VLSFTSHFAFVAATADTFHSRRAVGKFPRDGKNISLACRGKGGENQRALQTLRRFGKGGANPL
jgi:hypothetical protein